MLDENLLLDFIESKVREKSFEDMEPIIISKTPPVRDGNVEYLKFITSFIHSRINKEFGEDGFIYSGFEFNIIATLSNEFTKNEFLDLRNETYKSGYVGRCPVYVTPLLIDEIYALNKDASKILKFKIIR